MNLHGNVTRPGIAKLGHRHAGMKQQRPCGALPRLRQFLRRQNSERKFRVNHMMWQRRGCKHAFLDDSVEPDRLRERYAGLEIVKRSPFVEIRRVYGMTDLPDSVREGQYTGCKSLRMMKQQHFRHR
jgi:hypothetical protein